jgi:hypothetical protein
MYLVFHINNTNTHTLLLSLSVHLVHPRCSGVHVVHVFCEQQFDFMNFLLATVL